MSEVKLLRCALEAVAQDGLKRAPTWKIHGKGMEKNKNGRDACAFRPKFVCEAVIPVRGSHPD
jgi:hypothetical protein